MRARVCAGLRGDVVEIVYGSGRNQPHYPAAVTGVRAVEPSAAALRLAAPRRRASPVPVVDAGDDAQLLDLPTARFDAALCTWVLCGLPDPVRALGELARVLRPGAVLHVVEHGLAPDPAVVRRQCRARPLSRAVSGCVLDTDVPDVLARARFEVLELQRSYAPGVPRPVGATYEGRARLLGR